MQHVKKYNEKVTPMAPQIFFITGASSLLGRAFLRNLSPIAPHQLFLLDEATGGAEEEITQLNPKWDVTFIPTKKIDPQNFTTLAMEMAPKTDQIDFYIDLHVHPGPAVPTTQLPLKDLSALFQTNVFAPLALIQGVLPLIQKGMGKIIIPHYQNLEDRLAYRAAFAASRKSYLTCVSALLAEQAQPGPTLIRPAIGPLDIPLYNTFYPGQDHNSCMPIEQAAVQLLPMSKLKIAA